MAEARQELRSSNNPQLADLLDEPRAEPGDKSVGGAFADLKLAIIDRHIQELRDIDAASARMKDSSYGVCAGCGDDIPFERLMAYPTAKRCLACQARRESSYRHQATPTL